ncbi:MAG: flagellar protein FlgN, partial [Treponema sp.]|nr:flagellar protein FlgN [Treponema sp.]
MNEGLSEYNTCVGILKGEIEILGKISFLQDSVRTAVMNRDWTDFESLLGALQEYARQFEVLEEERVRFFSALGETNPGIDEKTGFYAFTARLPEAERTELTAAYRKLKTETLKMRLLNNSLMEYLNEARTTVAAFLEAVFPDRKGRLYSRRGIQKPADMRSMV